MITKVPNQYTELIPFEPILDKQKSVGGNSSRSSTTTTTTKKGYNSSSKNSNSCSCVFDSGCNLSGLRRVHIDVRPHKFIETTDGVLLFYPSAIRRIVFEFHDGRLEPSLLLPGGQQQQCGTADCDVNDDELPSSSSSSTTSTRSTLTTSTRSTLTTSSTDAANTNNTTTTMCVLEVSGGKNKNNDAVASIDVWSDDVRVNAVQFRMKSGKVSQLFGTYRYSGETAEDDDEPADAAAAATTFRPKDSSWKLVGVHGSINSDNVVGRLGFTFATSAYERHTS